jgi:nucleotide-binding universal stress UspA family protein
MWEAIIACGFEYEVESAMEEEGYPERVWEHAEMDEGSDEEDPMVTQANELSNIDSIVQLSHNMVELAGVRRDLKRARGSDQDA